jgi:hypothetical protein
VHDAHAVEVGDDPDQLQGDLPLIGFGEGGPSAVQQVEERALLDQFHDQQQLRRGGHCAEHEHDVGVAVLGEHADLVVELSQQLLGYVGVEDLLDRHLQLEEPPPVDCAEPAHRNLLPHLQVRGPEDQHAVHRLPLRLNLRLRFRLVSPPPSVGRL